MVGLYLEELRDGGKGLLFDYFATSSHGNACKNVIFFLK